MAKEQSTMKMGLSVLFSLSLCVVAVAGTNDVQSSLRASASCDSPCQLRSQDTAFSLLVETYRQFKGCQIEQRYQHRLESIELMSDRKGKLNTSLVLRSETDAMKRLLEFIRSLARAEHDLEMEGLQTQVVNFENAYTCIRRADEAELGITVTNVVDRKAAAKKLKDFVIVYQGAPSDGNFHSTASIPADAVLLDVEPGIPSESGLLIEACE